MQVVGINKTYYSMENNRIVECKTSTMISLNISVAALFARENTKNRAEFVMQCIKKLPDIIHEHNMEHLTSYEKYFVRDKNTLIFRSTDGVILKRVQIE